MSMSLSHWYRNSDNRRFRSKHAILHAVLTRTRSLVKLVWFELISEPWRPQTRLENSMQRVHVIITHFTTSIEFQINVVKWVICMQSCLFKLHGSSCGVARFALWCEHKVLNIVTGVLASYECFALRDIFLCLSLNSTQICHEYIRNVNIFHVRTQV
jgi:hypothetical protein